MHLILHVVISLVIGSSHFLF